MRNTLPVLLLLITAFPVFADGERDNNAATVRRVPQDGILVPADREKSLRDGLSALQFDIADLQKSKDATTQNLLPDVLIFERAVRVALDHNEFFSPKDIDKADQLLAEGSARADQLAAGTANWLNQSGLVVRGYISRIDNTVQPYGLVVPATYAFNHSVPTRCDLWFHGRGETLSEVNFIWDRMKNAGQFTPDHTIVLHPYGRYSNAFKFAGEVDVLEALEDVQKRYRIDEDRISVRGFSMGGAGCWQFATHYSDRWFASNPGAGFSETPEFLKFFQKETLAPTPWEVKLWNMYDCDKYAVNLAHCPTIAYSGEIDIQKQAADLMEAALNERNIRLKHIIGAGMGHKIDDVSKDIIEDGMTSLAKHGRNTTPTRLSFETHTLKYNRMHWLTVDALNEHWKPARVKALIVPQSNSRITVENITALSVNFPSGTFPGGLISRETLTMQIADFSDSAVKTLRVPGPTSDGAWSFRLQQSKADDGTTSWTVVDSLKNERLIKRHNLQGPVDDAFMDSFVFVRPTGTAANEAAGKWAASELDRAIEHWRRHFRGDARVVNDTDVTDEMILSANLVLWGDPSSNSVMAKVANKLPIVWGTKQITVGDNNYDATNHAPILIYPNPLNPNRYVVFNSSFTFRDYAYLNNARQVSMLPDWAIVDLTTPAGNVWPGKIVDADFFDETWQLKK